jgi:radical SAM superfamily enzyme YgiQ (UPF0313 family)
MAKIVFVQDSIVNENWALLLFSSLLKARGHQVDLFLLNNYPNYKAIAQDIVKADPDLVAFSVMTVQEAYYREASIEIKKQTHVPIIWGGAHCFTMPEEVQQIDAVDIICISEGENAIVELSEQIDKKQSYCHIENLWIRDGRGWRKNPISNLFTDLDKLPFPDRDLFYSRSQVLKNFPMRRMLTQRGCPYSCNYCFEPQIRAKHRGKGKWVRRHSVDYTIACLKETILHHETKTLHFFDDSFNLNKNWIREFSEKYKKQIDLPFTCNIAINCLDRETVELLSKAGCYGVCAGVESGNEDARTIILNKKVSNAQVEKSAALFHQYDIKFMTYDMFGLPNESLEDAIETVRFNYKTKVHGVRVSMLKIYKGTQLEHYVREKNLVGTEERFTITPTDVHGDFKYMEHLMWAAFILLKLPLLFPYAAGILRSPWIRFLKPLILLSYWTDIRYFQIPLRHAWKFFWEGRKQLVRGIGKKQ